MAVAMEVVSWRGAELGSSSSSPSVRKKRAWGADAQQLVQLMVGQLQSSQPVAELTLDLLGSGKAADHPASSPASSPASCAPKLPASSSPEFLHLDPDEDSAPLPSGWEKCLDLQTGKLYFVNKSSGVSSFDDPRKPRKSQQQQQRRRRRRRQQQQQQQQLQRPPAEIELRTQDVVVPPLAHEFLGSKRSETLLQESLKACSSSSSGSPRPTRVPPFSSGSNKQLWNLHLSDRGNSPSRAPDSILELDLNLAAGGGSSASPSRRHNVDPPQTVCTMEMIQNALKRSSEQPVKTPRLGLLKPSVSSSFSSLTNSTSPSPSGASPSTSSSSSTSSRSGTGTPPSNPSTTGTVCEAESVKVENVVEVGALVMGACTRCLMYVMLNKADPRCPRCDSKVPVDFSAPPCKKPRGGGLQLGFGSR